MFVGSIRQKPKYKDAFKRLITTLEKSGNQVIHKHVTQNSQADLDKMTKSDDNAMHLKIFKDIKKSDIVVSEVSSQSLSVGYLLAYASSIGKPLVTFYNISEGEPNLFRTLMSKSNKFFCVGYKDLDDLEQLALEYVDYAKEKIDVRFNFFISPDIGNYLDWISKEKKIPRSVYLRGLIEKDMENSDEYN